jgi:2-polyprenyl-6-hydroxyphenyl methylase/3-demethylubiquinone-9 3-methyltransferase
VLDDTEFEYLKGLPSVLPNLQWVCDELNRVWDDIGLNNKCLDNSKLIQYYKHPVWIMNGIYSAVDSESKRHRLAIAEYLAENSLHITADYGGGFGELALVISNNSSASNVYVVEPFPSRLGVSRLQGQPRIQIIGSLGIDVFDSVIAQDVLEHVEDPIFLAYQIANSTIEGGKLIFANCFYPLIKCHLPETFHLRFTFPFVLCGMGLKYCGTLPLVPHAHVFQVRNNLNLSRARKFETLSKIVGPFLNLLGASYFSVKSFFAKMVN